MSGQSLWNLAGGLDMSGLTGVFGELFEILPKRFLLHLSTFVVKTRIESF
jgi:hypothetical protein